MKKARSHNFFLGIIPAVVASLLFAIWHYESRITRSVRNMKTATQFLVTDLGVPHPYRLTLVPQYTMVYKVAEFLVRRDHNQQLVGGLAERWEISEDRRRIKFHFRKGALYNAEEVKQSLVRLLDAGQTTHSNLAVQTRSNWITVPNLQTLEIQTTGDAAAVLSPLVMADAAILPDDHWAKDSDSDPGRSQVDWGRSRGPYILVSGKLPMAVNDCVEYAPNSKHYLFSNDQMNWRLCRKPSSAFNDLANLEAELKKQTGFVTLLFSDFYRYAKTDTGNIRFYQTRPNGITFLHLNARNGVFKSRAARRTFLKKVFSTEFKLTNPNHRARQIAQPGLAGHMSDADVKLTLDSIHSDPEYLFEAPIRWSEPRKESLDTDWLNQLRQSINLPSSIEPGPLYPDEAEWGTGQYDVLVDQVGMSDTDPISGATFLFSPSGDNADLPDGSILKVLNSAKNTTDREVVGTALRKAFRMALEEAVVIPLFYNVNRHYYSDNLELNITDPFSESVDIENLRFKP